MQKISHPFHAECVPAVVSYYLKYDKQTHQPDTFIDNGAVVQRPDEIW